MNQVEVNTGIGVVRLKNISLDVQVVNEELRNILTSQDETPFQVAEVTVRELEAFISYSSIVNDSCHIVAHGVEISIIPSDISLQPKTKTPTSRDTNNRPEEAYEPNGGKYFIGF